MIDVKRATEWFSDRTDRAVIAIEKDGRVYGITTSVEDNEIIRQDIHQLKRWHHTGKHVKLHLSDLNKKRSDKGLKPVNGGSRPRKAVSVNGFDSNGISFEQLITELNSYSARRKETRTVSA